MDLLKRPAWERHRSCSISTIPTARSRQDLTVEPERTKGDDRRGPGASRIPAQKKRDPPQTRTYRCEYISRRSACPRNRSTSQIFKNSGRESGEARRGCDRTSGISENIFCQGII